MTGLRLSYHLYKVSSTRDGIHGIQHPLQSFQLLAVRNIAKSNCSSEDSPLGTTMAGLDE
jgi:hypothetical protein